MKTFKSYLNEEKVLELSEEEFDKYIDTLSDKELEELTEFIGGIARTAKKVLTAPVTIPYKAAKAVAKGVKNVATSTAVKKTGSGIGKLAKKSVVNKQGNFRFSTAGRADSAQAKLAKLKKKAADRARLSKAKAGIAALKKKPRNKSTPGPKPKPGSTNEDEFKPHIMWDPKTGKAYKAEKPEDHERMKKLGYTHEKPKIKEDKQMFVYHIRDCKQKEGNIHARSQIEAQVKAKDNGFKMPMSVTNKGVYDGKS